MPATRHPRRAVATIEFVMVFPLLVFLVAALFLIARASIAKESAASGARYKAWAARPSAEPGQIYRVNHEPSDSRVSGQHRVTVLPGPLFRNERFTADSVGFAIDRTWDHRDVPFDRLGDFKLHERPFKPIAQNIPGGSGVVTLASGLALLMNPQPNPLLIAARALGRAGNIAIRGAAIVLQICATIINPLRAVVAILKRAAQLSFRFGFARRLGRVLDLLDLIGRAVDNLDNASRGLPVENPGGLGSLRVP